MDKLRLKIYIFIISAFLGKADAIHAQFIHSKAEVRGMFPSNTRDLWINQLCGTIDNKHVVDMTIGTDGRQCKGFYTLRSSNTTFYFEGQDIEHHLKLVELNQDFRMTGFIFGKYDGEILEGQWMNSDKQMVLPMHLKLVKTFSEYSGDQCKTSHWQKIFRGKINDRHVKIQIIKDQLNFTWLVEEDRIKFKDLLPGKGTRIESFQLNYKNSVFNKKWIVLDTAALDKIDIVYLDENGYEVTTGLKEEASLKFECYEYADYRSRLECIRPVSANKKFNVWMENTLKDWMQHRLKEMETFENHDAGTRERWVISANGWVEVDLFMENMISGTVYMQDSWHNDTKKISFIYDLNAGKEMVLQDIFDSKFNSREYFRLVIPARKKEIQWNPEIKKWIDGQEFNYITLKEEGICFRTSFSTIYGEKEILIPYEQVELNLKNKNLLKDLLGK